MAAFEPHHPARKSHGVFCSCLPVFVADSADASGIAGTVAGNAKILFFLFFILLLISLVVGLFRRT